MNRHFQGILWVLHLAALGSSILDGAVMRTKRSPDVSLPLVLIPSEELRKEKVGNPGLRVEKMLTLLPIS